MQIYVDDDRIKLAWWKKGSMLNSLTQLISTLCLIFHMFFIFRVLLFFLIFRFFDVCSVRVGSGREALEKS